MRGLVVFDSIPGARKYFGAELALVLFDSLVDDENVRLENVFLRKGFITKFTAVADVEVLGFSVYLERVGSQQLSAVAARLISRSFGLALTAEVFVAHVLLQAATRQDETAKGARNAHLVMNVQNVFAQTKGERIPINF